MHVIKPTDRADVAQATGLGRIRTAEIWTLVVIACRRLGPQARVVVRPRTNHPPMLGIESSYKPRAYGLDRITLGDIHHPADDDLITNATRLEPAEESTQEIDPTETGYILSLPTVIEEVPRTELTVTAPDTNLSLTRSATGVDTLPSHLLGRSLKETYPFESQYYIYLVEGMRLFERVGDRLRAAIAEPVDSLSTVVIDGDDYAPATLTSVSDTGIETTHLSLDGDDVSSAMLAGGLLPPDLFDQIARTGQPRRGQSPRTDFSAAISSLDMSPAPPGRLNSDYSTWEGYFGANDMGESDDNGADSSTDTDMSSEGSVGHLGESVADTDDSEADQQADGFGWEP